MSDAPVVTDQLTVTVGDTLRNARMEQGWSVSQVADKLHLTAQAVESIENNQFERLPGITFARGYVRSYARILDLDSDQLVKVFDGLVENNTADSVQSIDRVGEARRVSRGMLQFSLFVVLLIIIGAAYYAWQSFNTEQSIDTSNTALFDRVEVERADGSMHIQTLDEPEESVELLVAEVSAESSEDINNETAVDSEQEATDREEGQLAATQQTEGQTAAVATESAKLEQSAAAVEQETAALDAGHGVVQMDFNADSWLSVVDAEGVRLYSGIKTAGEQLKVSGKPPINVHLGNAPGVRILYKGEPVEFSSTTSGGVARIKLGQ